MERALIGAARECAPRIHHRRGAYRLALAEGIQPSAFPAPELRLDTAPMHVSCTTFPLHLHDENGMVRAGPIVDASLDSWGCFSRLLDVLLLDPLLERFEVL